ncbi:deoxyribodipyrimidine photo-lyase [bacterium]|nr:deoxyribodipyrimidine photo-lyase [bacterium]
MIHTERIKRLNNKPVKKGRYVLYWMQASQRIEYNHALEFAIQKADEIRNPLLVFFGITSEFPDANERHYWFMLEGIREVETGLKNRGITMIVWHRSPEKGVIELSLDASLVVADRGYLKIQKEWRRYAAEHMDCPFIQVETDAIVPVEAASQKEEYAASTIRQKIKRCLPDYLVPLDQKNPRLDSMNLRFDTIDVQDIEKLIPMLNIDRSAGRVKTFHGGSAEAKKHLQGFLKDKLHRFHELRNDPAFDYLSNMSPYLHFGQISPLYIALKVLQTDSPGMDAYLEELIIRRELGINFVFYNDQYDSFNGLPVWAKKTLLKHQGDAREYLYSPEEMENAQTHDPYWNAAQKEMVITGKMHGYMRMYWVKKILEWSISPEDAFNLAIYLNNKYELDGRDTSGYAGVAWGFGKHDRPWGERKIFGNIRYMNDKGLRRKFDMDQYIKRDFNSNMIAGG